MRWRRRLMMGGFAFGAAALSACDNSAPEPVTIDRQPASAPAGPDGIQIAYAKDGDLIRLAGKVTSIGEDGFMLDYGTGPIDVVSSSTTKGAAGLKVGEEVTVVGRLEKRPGRERVVASEIAAQTKP